jgi:hypothetical protein
MMMDVFRCALPCLRRLPCRKRQSLGRSGASLRPPEPPWDDVALTLKDEKSFEKPP